MIDLIFHHANEVIIIRIKGHSVLFGNTTYGAKMANIEGLRLDYHGVIRQFPDLGRDIYWREKAIERFKEHISTLKTEEEIAEYIVKELRSKGYFPKLKQVAGFRPVRIH